MFEIHSDDEQRGDRRCGPFRTAGRVNSAGYYNASMRWIATFLLLAAAIVPAGELDGKITSGKAKKIFKKAIPFLKEAYALRQKLMDLDENSPELEPGLRKCVALYDKATILLNDALEIKYDPGVNAMLVRAAREMAKSRAGLTWIENRRRVKEIEEERRRNPKPKPDLGPDPKPDLGPKPKPKPKPRIEPKPDPEPVRRVPKFEAKHPPARPSDIAPQRPDGLLSLSDDDWIKRNKKGIRARLKDYYGARKRNKLRVRCKLCAGKGTYRDGSECDECHASGVQVNLHYFRKVYWNGFTPLLRDSAGALPALAAFLDHARQNPESLASEVATYKLVAIEPHGEWARVRVAIKTSEGESEEALVLISIGSTWFFFHPTSDEELVAASRN